MAAISLVLAVRVGVETLRANPLRTILSTLGVIVGVASLVAVLSLGDGMERSARAEVERTTSVQSVVVAPRLSETIDGETYPTRDYPIFGAAEARAIRDEVPGAMATMLTASGRARVTLMGAARRRTVSVTATTADAVDYLDVRLAAGRFFTEAEVSRGTPVVVLSWTVAAELANGRDPLALLGAQARVGPTPREVIGIAAPYEGERCCAAVIPITGAGTTLGRTLTPSIFVKARRVEDVNALEAAVQDWLAIRYGHGWPRRVEVITALMRLAQTQRGMATFKLFMGAITGISLIVGGIGIMNVLLASVTERTREIGIRKATGARRRDILAQFLAESVVISGAGSLLGVALGLVGAFGITAIIRATA